MVMSFVARVVNVMIASPSDVGQERAVIKEVIYKWNILHAERARVVLLPVHWETHSYPSFGDRPQAIINKQILDQCDLLIAIFWTRLGTHTGEAASGTVEEIQKHVGSGKAAMIYFSDAPVRLDSVDPQQYESLKEFRKWCQSQGLVESYASIQDFTEKIDRQLTIRVQDDFTNEPNLVLEMDPIPTARQPRLSAKAAQLLIEASHDREGVIVYLRSMDGVNIQTNGKDFAETGNPRSEAEWKGALEELAEQGLVESRGFAGQIFNVTANGYTLADSLESTAP